MILPEWGLAAARWRGGEVGEGGRGWPADQDQFLMLPRRSLCRTNQKYLKGAFRESQTTHTT